MSKDSLSILPAEIVLHIASYLSTDDVLRGMACANRRLKFVVDEFGYIRHIRNGPANAAPLWFAARHGLSRLAARVLSLGADPNRETNDAVLADAKRNATPLAIAVQNKDTAMVELLLVRRANPMAMVHKETTLTRSVLDGTLEIAMLLLEHERRRGQALQYKQPEDMAREQQIFESKLVNAQSHMGLSPLHKAAETGDDEMIKLLLDHGARIKAKNSRGLTPLFVAVECGHTTTIRLLLLAGADPVI